MRTEMFSNSGNILDLINGFLLGNGEEFIYPNKTYKKKEGINESIY